MALKEKNKTGLKFLIISPGTLIAFYLRRDSEKWVTKCMALFLVKKADKDKA